MSFFKVIDGVLYDAPNFVESPTVVLVKEDRETYTYPQDGWYWFDTEAEAIAHFGDQIVPPQEPVDPVDPV